MRRGLVDKEYDNSWSKKKLNSPAILRSRNAAAKNNGMQEDA